MYVYEATIVRIIDGDSLVCDLSLGRHIWVRDAKHRLAGCNAIELHDPGGAEARDNLASLLPAGQVVTLASLKPYKYGDEYMAQITLPDGSDLVSRLIADGWLAAWNGLGARPVPPWPRV